MGSGAPREVFEVAREVFEVARAVDEVVGHPMSHTARIANGTMSSASSVSRTYDVMSRRARHPMYHGKRLFTRYKYRQGP